MRIAVAGVGYAGPSVALLPNSWSDELTNVADRVYICDLFRRD